MDVCNMQKPHYQNCSVGSGLSSVRHSSMNRTWVKGSRFFANTRCTCHTATTDLCICSEASPSFCHSASCNTSHVNSATTGLARVRSPQGLPSIMPHGEAKDASRRRLFLSAATTDLCDCSEASASFCNRASCSSLHILGLCLTACMCRAPTDLCILCNLKLSGA